MRKCRPSVSLIASSLAFAGCVANAPSPGEDKVDPSGPPSDVQSALEALPDATVLLYTQDGLPMYIVGELAKVGQMQTDDAAQADALLRPALPPIMKAFRMDEANLALRLMNTDENGHRHFRYTQNHNGVPVIGGDLVVHVDIKGAVYSVNGTARGDIEAALGANPIAASAATSAIRGDARFTGLTVTPQRVVYIQADDGSLHKAYEQVAEGMRGQSPARDKVYVDQDSGEIIAVHPQIHFAMNRRVYSANNGTSTPGTLRRSEGQAATTDVDVNAAYDNTGSTWETYKFFFNRDSYNNNGATLSSTVHYSNNYCNAYWDGSQMVYGDGSASQGCKPLARSLDVTGHELTHGVTQYESNLTYSGEPGGINEAMSDIFGTLVEAYVAGGKTGNLTITSNTWLLGEDVITGGLRHMCDPAKDGVSKDYWTSSTGSVDVHYSSGIANLVFCLLSKGGTHPRGKSNIPVAAIGMEKAARIFYKAQTDILTSSSKYAALRTAAEQAATALGYDQATKDAVSCAFAAVGVGTAPTTCGGSGGGGGGGGGTTVLTNGVPKTGLSDAAGGQAMFSIAVPTGQTSLTIAITGGTGDADLYVQSGSAPTTTTYQCRPYKDGNVETCTFSPPSAGTYYVMLHAYTAYSGVSLTATYSATGGGGGGDPYLNNGQAVTNISGAAGSATYWRVAPGAGKTLSVRISGGTGDADLYTRQGARPTTSTYACRPYLNGNTETCTTTGTVAGDYYVMVRGYSAYSGLQLIASY